MTSEEMERAIEILLNNQASYEHQFEQTNRQIEQTNRQLEQTNGQLAILAETQREFMEVVIQHIEAQGKINKAIRGSIRDLSKTVERYINEGRNGKS